MNDQKGKWLLNCRNRHNPLAWFYCSGTVTLIYDNGYKYYLSHIFIGRLHSYTLHTEFASSPTNLSVIVSIRETIFSILQVILVFLAASNNSISVQSLGEYLDFINYQLYLTNLWTKHNPMDKLKRLSTINGHIVFFIYKLRHLKACLNCYIQTNLKTNPQCCLFSEASTTKLYIFKNRNVFISSSRKGKKKLMCLGIHFPTNRMKKKNCPYSFR